MNTVFCKTTNKGEQSFYLVVDRAEYYLFTQKYRKSNKQYFQSGIDLDNVYNFSGVNSFSTRKTLERLQKFIPYMEKEYGLVLRNQTKRKTASHNRKFQQKRDTMHHWTTEFVQR